MDHDPSLTDAPSTVLGEEPTHDPVKEYAERVRELRLGLECLQADVAETDVTLVGVRTHRTLAPLETRYSELHTELSELRAATTAETLSVVSTLDADPSVAADREFRRYVRDGDLRQLLDGHDAFAARVGQGIRSKRDAATARIALVISVLAVVVSLIALLAG